MSDDFWNNRPDPDDQDPKKPDTRRVAAVILGVVLGVALAFTGMKVGVDFMGERLVAALEEEGSLVGEERGPEENDGLVLGETEADEQEDPGSESESALVPEESKSSLSMAGSEQQSGYVVIDVSEVVANVKPTVVSILSQFTYTVDMRGQQISKSGGGSGSGVIIGRNDSELLIVTNNHVVTEDTSYYYSVSQDEIKVKFIDGTEVDALVKGTDSQMDIAVLAVKLNDIPTATMSAIRTAQIGDSDALREGEGAIAVGNALGYGLSVTFGIISATDREIRGEDDVLRHVLQTDAAINPGNSGGGLFNTKGELIGINEAKDVKTSVEGMGFALPITECVEVIETLMNLETKEAYPEAQQGFLGVSGQDITPDIAALYNMPCGLWVNQVSEGSPAALAGIQPKDIITGLDAIEINSFEDLRTALSYYTGGTHVTITIRRIQNGEYLEQSFDCTLGFRGQYTE